MLRKPEDAKKCICPILYTEKMAICNAMIEADTVRNKYNGTHIDKGGAIGMLVCDSFDCMAWAVKEAVCDKCGEDWSREHIGDDCESCNECENDLSQIQKLSGSKCGTKHEDCTKTCDGKIVGLGYCKLIFKDGVR